MRYPRMVVAVLLAAPLLAAVAAGPAAAADCVAPGTAVAEVGWAQLALGPDRTGPLSQGAGQRVAVLSTGVDAHQQQLAGRVEGGADTADGGQPAGTDCAGAGTQVAGVIAAAKRPDAGFAGLAPAARIMPIRVLSGQGGSTVDAADLAAGIQAALSAGATVICAPVAVYDASDALRGAVTEALAAGVPVVAAAGDGGSRGNPAPYPAAYPGVIAVTALDPAGYVVPDAGSGDFVTLGAPGRAVDTLQAGGGLIAVDGTGVAAGAVAGTVALLLSRFPGMHLDQLARRLTATATPIAGYPADPALAGMVDPFRALSEAPAGASPAAVPGYQPASPDAVQVAQAGVRDRALLAAAGALLLALLVTLLARFAPRGRRRSWRATMAPPPAPEPPPAEASPPVLLFEDHAGSGR